MTPLTRENEQRIESNEYIKWMENVFWILHHEAEEGRC